MAGLRAALPGDSVDGRSPIWLWCGFASDSIRVGIGSTSGSSRPAAQEFRCHRGTLTTRGFRRADWPCFPTCPRLSSFFSWSGSGSCRSCSPGISPIWPKRTAFVPSPIIAPRGAMLDRDGRVLVDSYPSFSILLLRDNPKLLEKSLPQIEEGLGHLQGRSRTAARCRQGRTQVSAGHHQTGGQRSGSSRSSIRTARIFPCSI